LRTQLTHALARFCFGAFGGWPAFAPADLKRTVELINTAVAGVRRRVDWVHIPTLDTSDQAFYAPLANLDAKGARVYLGAIHNMSTLKARLDIARKFLPECVLLPSSCHRFCATTSLP
jgi:hypothetical protein